MNARVLLPRFVQIRAGKGGRGGPWRGTYISYRGNAMPCCMVRTPGGHAVACRPCEYAVCPTGHECAQGVHAETAIATAQQVLAATAENSRAAA